MRPGECACRAIERYRGIFALRNTRRLGGHGEAAGSASDFADRPRELRKKAAATALALMHRYTGNTVLLNKMSRLAREELRHFEQVVKLMTRRDICYRSISASRYAQGLHKGVRRQEPGRLIDTLIVGALIEARSCERFARLAPELDR